MAVTTADPPLLDISAKFRTPSPERVRAATRFGLDARRHILRSGAAMESRCASPQESLFMTGTLPGSTPQALVAIATHADYIVDRLKSWLSKQRQDRLDIYVWELQKRGALHIHYVTHIPDKKARDRVRRGFHREWCNLLDAVGRKAGVDMYQKGFGDGGSHDRSVVQAYAVEVEKSVAAYLSKYVSKQHNVLTKFNERYAPKRWWGRSRPLKALTDALSTRSEEVFSSLQEGIQYIRNVHDDLTGLSASQYSYQHKAGPGETRITYVLRSLWNMARNIVSLRGTGHLTKYGTDKISKSRTLELLNVLTENFSRYSRCSRVGIEPGFMQSMKVCLAMQSNWQSSGFGCVKAWINNLLVLSSRLTCHKMTLLDHRFWDDPDLHPIHHLWKLRELIWSLPSPSWEDIKLCDQYLDKVGWSVQAGTSPLDEGAGVEREPEPSSLPLYTELTIF